EMLEHQLVESGHVRNLERLTVEGCRDSGDRIASTPVVARDGWLEPLFHTARTPPWRIKIEAVRGSPSCFEVTADDHGTVRRIRVPTEFDACGPSRPPQPQLAQ